MNLGFKSQNRLDKSYIAPQLTTREKVTAGVFVLLDAGFFLFIIGIPVLALNLFSPSFPRRWKLGNALALLFSLALISAILAVLLRRVV